MRQLLLACLCIALSAPAWGQTTYYVDAASGSDTNSGLTLDGAVRTIQAGVALAAAGDTVVVNQGAYTESLHISGKPGLVLKAQGATLVSSGNVAVQIVDCSGMRLSGFHIRSAIHGVIVAANAIPEHAVELNDLRISHCERGVVMGGSAVVAVKDCVFHDCSSIAIQYEGTSANALSVQHCTIALCGVGIWAGSGSLHISVKNSLLYKNSTAFLQFVPVDGSFLALFGNARDTSGGVVPGVGLITADPLIMDEAARDFTLRPGSPLLGAADPDDSFHARIGAFGLGAAASAAPDPAVAFSDFHNWTDGGGRGVGDPAGQFSFNPQGAVLLNDTLTAAALTSPVHDFGAVGRFNAIRLCAQEDFSGPSGSRHVLDADPTTLSREIEYRASTTPFAAGAADPPFVSTFRNQVNDVVARYVQVRLTFRRDAR